MEDGSLAVSQHRTTLHRTPALNIATRCIIVPAPCGGEYKPVHREREEALRLHTHTRERRELGCHSHRCLRRPCQSSSTLGLKLLQRVRRAAG
jgi:hypothetical protein